MGDAEQQDQGGNMFDDPNREAVGLDPAWVEGTGGEEGTPVAKSNDGEEKLPGQHAGLDELAEERGHTWSRDDLTVKEKQEELGG
jgi:hypothetical protein